MGLFYKQEYYPLNDQGATVRRLITPRVKFSPVEKLKGSDRIPLISVWRLDLTLLF